MAPHKKATDGGTAPKPKASTKEKATPKQRAPPKERPPPPERFIATRRTNANFNPGDLEGSYDEDEEPSPKRTGKRKKLRSKQPKPPKKTQDELDAELQKRGLALEAVSVLEDDMARMATLHESTPRAPSAAKVLSKSPSYVAPDPPSPPRRQSKKPQIVMSTTENDSEEERRPTKKTRPLREAVNAVTSKRAKTAAAADTNGDRKPSVSGRKAQVQREVDMQADIDVVKDGQQDRLSRLLTSADNQNDFMDIDEPHTRKKAPAIRAAMKQNKKAPKVSSDDEMAPALTETKKKPVRALAVEDLFGDAAEIVAKREKVLAPEPIEIDTDSSIEIVEENLFSKPQMKQKPGLNKGKAKQSVNVVAPIKGKLSDVKKGSAENDRTKAAKRDRDSFQGDEKSDQEALVNDWHKVVLQHNPKHTGRSNSSATLTAGSSRYTESSKASTSRTAVNNRVKIKETLNEPLDNSDGAFSERDERYSGERTRAANSPFKGKGKRVTSSVSIKVEERDVKPSLTTDGKKPTSRARNYDLPEEFTENKAWRILMSSLFRYIATTDQVFNINDSVMLRSLQILCSHFYSNTGVSVTITTSSPAFRLASQRLSDCWRSLIGSAAIAALLAFFDSVPHFRHSDSHRKKYAKENYIKKAFLYKSAEGSNRKKYKGLFENTFIIQTFAAHLNCVSDSQEVLQLYEADGITDKSDIPMARGALGLCGAAVMRAYALVASDSITLASIAAAKAQKRKKSQGPKLPAIIPPITEKEIEHKINRLSKFSGKGWAGSTKSMIKLCKREVSDATIKDIIREAKEVSRASRRFAKEDEDGSDFDNDDSILDLHNGSDDSGNEDATHDRGMKDVDGQEDDDSDGDDGAESDDNMMVRNAGQSDIEEDEEDDMDDEDENEE